MGFWETMAAQNGQQEINEYYKRKKAEIEEWLIEKSEALLGLTDEQKHEMHQCAKKVSVKSINGIRRYIRGLESISQNDKTDMEKYLKEIEWLPTQYNIGYIDGTVVRRISEQERSNEELFRTVFGELESDEDDYIWEE